MVNSLTIRYTGYAHKSRLKKKGLTQNTKIYLLKTTQGTNCDTTLNTYPSDTFVTLFLQVSILRQKDNNWFRKLSLAVVHAVGQDCHVFNCYISSDKKRTTCTKTNIIQKEKHFFLVTQKGLINH